MDDLYAAPKAELQEPRRPRSPARVLPAIPGGLAFVAAFIYGFALLARQRPYMFDAWKFWGVAGLSSLLAWLLLVVFRLRSPWIAALLGAPLTLLGVLGWVALERSLTGTITW